MLMDMHVCVPSTYTFKGRVPPIPAPSSAFPRPFAIDQRIRPAESIVRSVPVSLATGEQHLPLRAYSGTVFEIRLPFPLRAPIRQSPLEDAQGYIKSTAVSNHCSLYQ